MMSATRTPRRILANAVDRICAAHLQVVTRRLNRFISNRDASPAWDYVWRRARKIEREE
jgi:hypothetical protein